MCNTSQCCGKCSTRVLAGKVKSRATGVFHIEKLSSLPAFASKLLLRGKLAIHCEEYARLGRLQDRGFGLSQQNGGGTLASPSHLPPHRARISDMRLLSLF